MLSTLFYRNPRLTLLTLGLILVAGFSGFEGLARQEDPTLSRRFATVTSFYPGATAVRVESLVTEKIEIELQELHEIKKMDSTSRSGVSLIKLELEDQYYEDDVDEIWSKVRDHLGDAQVGLPPGASAPLLEDQTSTAITLLSSLTWDPEFWEGSDAKPRNAAILSRLAEELQNRLRNLPGTRETEIFGEDREEIRVTVDPEALASVDLTAAEISSAITRADAKLPAGQLRHGVNDLLIEVEGELDSLERIRRVPLRLEAGGRMLRVGDLARVERTVQEPAETVAYLGGRPGVAVAVTMESGLRVDRWSRNARAIVEGFRAELPAGVSLEIIFDQSGYTEARLASLAGNLVMGAGIVVLVLFFLMGARSALVVASALPLTVAMVLAELQLLGVPLHQTSITGLIIALGLLIDNAIVVVDDYNALARAGRSPLEAIRGAVGHLFVPLFASTLTTVLAFLPIVLMPGGAGEFVGPISIGVGLSVVSSFLLAMTIIPALAGYFTPKSSGETPAGASPWWRVGFSHPTLTAVYRRSVATVLRRPALGVAVSLVLPVLGFAAAPTLVEQFFPPNDRNQFQVQLVLPSQASLEETRRQVLRARELIHSHEEVVESHWVAGEAAPRVFYNMFANADGVSSFAGGFVTTRSPDATEQLLPRLQRELQVAFPGARIVALPFEQGPPFDAPIEVRVLGPEVGELRRLGDELRGILAETDRVTYTTASLMGGEPKLMVRADEDEAQLAGLRLADIAEELNASLEGSLGGTIIEATEEIPVRVRVDASHRADLTSIASLRVLAPGPGRRNSGGVMPGVPLPVISEIDLVPEVAGITRRDGQRSNTVQAFLEPYALIAKSLGDFRRRLDASELVVLPPGYALEFGGETELRSEALGNLLLFALPLFIVMAGTIILSFNSFRMAGIIAVVAGLSVGLAILGVWMFGHPMGFVAIVGTMGLVGLAINGGIVVLSALRASPEARAGSLAATEEIVVGATRHIVATTLTTIGGFLPLILFGGRFWPPMATAIAGGVGGSAILALYLVPSMFRWFVVREVRREALAPKAAQADDRRLRELRGVAAG